MALVLKKCQLILLCSFFMILQHSSQQNPQTPCFFIYGDSIFDNGNNNNLTTLARTNYLPYGIDFFPLGPTGRFTNGRNLADILALKLGFRDLIPPFARVSGNQILKGVNYASGGAGILEETGRTQGARISFPMQIENHRITVSRIAQILGNNNSSAYLRQCLYTTYIGNNDYLQNYFMPLFYNTSRQYMPQQFADLLIQNYTQQLRALYALGARKIALFGLGKLGCTPSALSKFPTLGSPCVNIINIAVNIFNVKLKSAVDELNRNFTDAKFIYINTDGIESGVPLLPGFRVRNAPCCLVNRATGLCLPLSIPCPNRNAFFFWDDFHPTQAVYSMTGARAYKALLPSDAYPYDISHLAAQR